MKKIVSFVYFLLVVGQVFSQNYIFTGTGNQHNAPYGVPNNLSWGIEVYEQYTYKSPVDYFYMPYRLMKPPVNDPVKKYPLFVMLHGGGEGMGTPTDLSLPPNTAQLMWGAQIAKDSSGKYPSYVLFPQTQGGWWGNNGGSHYGWTTADSGYWAPVRCVFEIIDKLILENPNIDLDRIYLGGLSIGARGAWEMMERRPDLFAATSPFQGMGDSTLASTLINNPIWNFQGDQDSNPAGWETQALYDVLVSKGGNPRRSEYVDRDHWSWVDAYQNKTWMQWVYAQDKKNINILFGKGSAICPGQSITLGIGYGFQSYQWIKDGANIPGATTYVCPINSPGTYSVVFQRKNGDFVTSNPKIITPLPATAKPTVVLSGSPALATGGSLTLSAPAGSDKYLWSNNATSSSITVNAAGSYFVSVTKGSTCPGISDIITVTSGKDTTLLAPSGLAIVPGNGQAALSWLDNSANETGFEVIYSTMPGNGNIVYSGILPANTVAYTATGLLPATTYYAQTRAISAQGYSDYTAQVLFTIAPDTLVPTAPANLISTDKTASTVSLSWAASTDNYGVKGYNIYNGTTLAGSAAGTNFIVTGLTAATAYNFTVKAKDAAGNLSLASNLLSVTTTATPPQGGLSYAYYEGNWSAIPSFTGLTPVKTGKVTNFDLSPRNRTTQYVFKFDGLINITVAGQYTFYTTSDDGSKLYINGQLVVNNDFLQGATERSGAITLAVGLQPIQVTFLQAGGDAVLSVSYQGPGIAKQVIPASLLFLPAGGTNILPVANAGADKSITLPTNSLTINGSATDSDGSVTAYAWTQVSGPAATLSGAATANLALSALGQGAYVFRLTATDNAGGTAFDDVAVLVNPAVNNQAGLSYSYYEGNWSAIPSFTGLTPIKTGKVTNFDLSPRNRTTQYVFKFDGLINITTAGSYTFYTTSDDGSKLYINGQLVVNNDFLQGATERSGTITLAVGLQPIQVTFLQAGGDAVLSVSYQGPGIAKQVIPASLLFLPAGGTNILPVANAGADKTITLPTNSLTINGSAADSDGSVTAYAWTQVSGPAATLSGAATANLALSALVQGSYVFRLTATDNAGGTAFDDVAVLVNPAVNNQAGLSYSYYEGNWSAIPSFTGLTPVKTGKVTNFDLSPRNRTTQYVFKFDGLINITVAGQYTFYTTSDDGSKLYINGQLVVNNDFLQGATERSGTITLAVGLQPIQVTFLQAGGDAVLSVSYQGPGIAKQVIPASLLFLPAGGTNILPVANAGADKTITLPTNSLTINGSAADSDGSVTAYAWTQVSGPAATLSGVATANLALSALVQGSYVFRLTATDNAGGTAFDDVAVLVNPAVNNQAGLSYSYYEGNWSAIPSFTGLTPVKTGKVTNFDLSPRNRTTQYVFKFDGLINITVAGQYTLYTTSDDGSKLYINGQLVVNNDFLQGATERSGAITLAVGLQPIQVTFLQAGGDAVLSVSYQGPGIAKQVIPASLLFQSGAARMGDDASLEDADVNASIQLFPNPAFQNFTITYNGRTNQGVEIKISDMLGQELYKEVISGSNGSFSRTLDTEPFRPGMYSISVNDGLKVINKTLMVVH